MPSTADSAWNDDLSRIKRQTELGGLPGPAAPCLQRGAARLSCNPANARSERAPRLQLTAGGGLGRGDVDLGATRDTCGVSEIEQAVKEIEAYVAADGWDGPVRVFSLVDAATAMSVNSALAAELPADATGLLSIEQEGLPSSDSIDELLGRLAWPDAVDGAAISLERVTLPPEAEAEIPDDAEEARRFVAADPRREDIRMVVGVLRNGESWCTIRLRSHDSQAEAISGADLVPEMIEALLATFAD